MTALDGVWEKQPQSRFEAEALMLVIECHFPNMPKTRVKTIAHALSKRVYEPKLSATKAVSVGVHTHIRHNLTRYEKLMKENGACRSDARASVAPKVDEIYRSWASTKDQL